LIFAFFAHTRESAPQRLVELSNRLAFVPLSLLNELAWLDVQHRNRLYSRM